MGVKEEWTGARAEQHLRKEVCGQAVDVQEDIWRMHDPVRDTAAALSAELGLRQCAARHALLPCVPIDWDPGHVVLCMHGNRAQVPHPARYASACRTGRVRVLIMCGVCKVCMPFAPLLPDVQARHLITTPCI